MADAEAMWAHAIACDDAAAEDVELRPEARDAWLVAADAAEEAGARVAAATARILAETCDGSTSRWDPLTTNRTLPWDERRGHQVTGGGSEP